MSRDTVRRCIANLKLYMSVLEIQEKELQDLSNQPPSPLSVPTEVHTVEPVPIAVMLQPHPDHIHKPRRRGSGPSGNRPLNHSAVRGVGSRSSASVKPSLRSVVETEDEWEPARSDFDPRAIKTGLPPISQRGSSRGLTAASPSVNAALLSKAGRRSEGDEQEDLPVGAAGLREDSSKKPSKIMRFFGCGSCFF